MTAVAATAAAHQKKKSHDGIRMLGNHVGHEQQLQHYVVVVVAAVVVVIVTIVIFVLKNTTHYYSFQLVTTILSITSHSGINSKNNSNRNNMRLSSSK